MKTVPVDWLYQVGQREMTQSTATAENKHIIAGHLMANQVFTNQWFTSSVDLPGGVRDGVVMKT